MCVDLVKKAEYELGKPEAGFLDVAATVSLTEGDQDYNRQTVGSTYL